MKIVYCHNRALDEDINSPIVIAPRGGSTVAMEAIPSWLLDQLKMGSTIEKKLGIARCSDDDNYCKKTGRELAQSRLKSALLKVVNIVKVATFVTVFFEDKDGNLFEVKKSNDPYCAKLIRMLND